MPNSVPCKHFRTVNFKQAGDYRLFYCKNGIKFTLKQGYYDGSVQVHQYTPVIVQTDHLACR